MPQTPLRCYTIPRMRTARRPRPGVFSYSKCLWCEHSLLHGGESTATKADVVVGEARLAGRFCNFILICIFQCREIDFDSLIILNWLFTYKIQHLMHHIHKHTLYTSVQRRSLLCRFLSISFILFGLSYVFIFKSKSLNPLGESGLRKLAVQIY